MEPQTLSELSKLTGLAIYPRSLSQQRGVVYFLGRQGRTKRVGSVGRGGLAGQVVGQLKGCDVIVGPADAENARVLRAALPWTGPSPVGLRTSVGLGDRLGLATPGHIQAVRETNLACVLAQQSIREMSRTRRSPQQVIDQATWGVFQEGFQRGFGADADHMQNESDVEATAAAGFTMYTIDPGARVDCSAPHLDASTLRTRYEALDFATLGLSADDLRRRYAERTFLLADGDRLHLSAEEFARAAVKYAGAVAHVVTMYRRLSAAVTGDFDLEVSVDETDTPTTMAEHYFVASELRRLGVPWTSLAPRFVGRFEKGVDYQGDLDEFRQSFAGHVAVMRTLGPYKLSIHSGSDKFAIYPIVAELAAGQVHLKTAGTSYLEALRTVAAVDPRLFREILQFARERYNTDKATYHVSATKAQAPRAELLEDRELPALLDDFHVRQILHVTYGSVLTHEDGRTFGSRLMADLETHEEVYAADLRQHLGRHVEPFANAVWAG